MKKPVLKNYLGPSPCKFKKKALVFPSDKKGLDKKKLFQRSSSFPPSFGISKPRDEEWAFLKSLPPTLGVLQRVGQLDEDLVNSMHKMRLNTSQPAWHHPKIIEETEAMLLKNDSSS